MQRAGHIRPIGLLLLLLLLQAGHQCQATADCMKNPFASVCRGISAKRSGVPLVPASSAANNEQKQQQRLLASQQQLGQRANELADLLNKLNSLNQQQQQQQQAAPPPPPPRPLAELLVRHWTAAGPAKTMWPVALGDYLYYERQPTDSMPPYAAPVASSGIGATGNE